MEDLHSLVMLAILAAVAVTLAIYPEIQNRLKTAVKKRVTELAAPEKPVTETQTTPETEGTEQSALYPGIQEYRPEIL